MSIDVEELLAAELHSRANAVTWQPALLDGALRRHRKRELRQRAALAAGAACVASAVLVASATAALSGQRVLPGQSGVKTVAYVLSRVRSAVGTARADVLEVRSQLGNGWSYTAWFDPATGKSRVDEQPPAGGPVFFYFRWSRTIIVDYQARTYVTGHLSAPMRQLLLPVTVSWGGLAALPTPAVIRRALASGSFRLVGVDTVHGQRLLHYRGTDKLPSLGPADGGYHTLDIWINAATYLPVKSVTGVGPYTPRMRSTFTWLPATRQNLAVFTPQIPTGFRDETSRLIPVNLPPTAAELNHDVDVSAGTAVNDLR